MRIIVSLPDQENEFQLLQAADARAAAARLDAEVTLLDAEGSPVLQIQQILKAIHSEPAPAALVVEPLSIDTIVSVVRKAVKAGIGVGILNCTLEGLATLRESRPDVPIFAVGSDQVEIGRVQARQLRTLLPDGGPVLYIHGPQTATAARERFEGFRQETQDARLDMTVLDGHWSESSAERAVSSWLRLRRWEKAPIAAVAAQDDSMARGARHAIEANPDVAPILASLPLLGIDGVPEVGQTLVNEGVLTATVVMPSNTGPAVDWLGGWVRSGTQPPASVVLAARSYPEVLTGVRRGPKRRSA